MLDAGVNVCIGTDGMASNNNHDMFQDMYLMGLIYKGAQLDPAIVSPKQVLAAATRTGALAQGREDCGLVAEGMRADLCVLDVTGPSWCPMTDAAVNVVFAGHVRRRLTHVRRQGDLPRRRVGRIDVERAKAEVVSRTQRIIGEL